MKPGPKPHPARRRNRRFIVSLPNDVAEAFGFETDKSRVAESALRIFYGMPEHQRDAMLTALLVNGRIGVQQSA